MLFSEKNYAADEIFAVLPNINFVLSLAATEFMASNEYDSCTILMLPEPENSLEQRDISLSLASLERKQKKNENDETAVGP